VTPRRLEHNISKTAGERHSVPKDHYQEMAYGVSNGHVTDDVTWRRKVKLVTSIRLQYSAISGKQMEMLF